MGSAGTGKSAREAGRTLRCPPGRTHENVNHMKASPVSIEKPNGLAADSSSDRKLALGDALRRRIITMDIAPGAVLDEVELSEEFGISRPPVRELLRQMAGEGYIELEANRPARVTSMSYQSLREYYLVAPMIYMATTKLAAEKATEADVHLLRDVQSEFRRAAASGDVRARIFANNEFHFQIGKIARNEYLMPSLRRILIDHGRIGRTFFGNSPEVKQQLDQAVHHHDQIIDAIERHDPEAAALLVREHFDLSRRNLAAYAAPEGMSMDI